MKARSSRTTIRDIAKAANVSINTVSRALNNKGDVKKETQERILAIAEELDYVPNLLARGLLHDRTLTIGVVVTDNSNPFYARVLRGAGDCARQAGYSIILCNSDEDPDRESETLRTLKAKRVDGIIITPASTRGRFLESLSRHQVPFVLLNRSTDDANVDYVKTDNVRGAELAVDRLIETGRRRICYLGGPERISSAVERREGCTRAVRAAGLPEDALTVVETELHMEDGYDQMRRILRDETRPDGVFAYSDIVAIGAMRAIREAGLKIPDDIAVIGYDDIEIASYLEVRLTTIRQKRYELGYKSCELLLARISEAADEQMRQHVVFTPELIIRDSG